MSRFVKPKSERLTLANGDFIDVKRRLNQGEQDEMFSWMAPYTTAGEKTQLETKEVMTAKVLEYLLTWSFTDDDGTPVAYSPDMPEAARRAALKNMDPDDFLEVRQAIDQHEERVSAARAKEKNAKAGETVSSATLPSPSVVTGASSGSVN